MTGQFKYIVEVITPEGECFYGPFEGHGEAERYARGVRGGNVGAVVHTLHSAELLTQE